MTKKFEKVIRIISIILFGLLLGYSVYITQKNNSNKEALKQANINLGELRKITSVTPKVNLEQVLKDQPIYLPGENIPIYHNKYIDRPYTDPDTFNKLAISDSTARRLLVALDLKQREVTNITNLYTTVSAENLALKQKPNTHDFEYLDKYIYIKLNDSTKTLSDVKIKNDLSIVNYHKRKWFLAPKQYYTSVVSQSPYLGIDSIGKITKQNPKNIFSLYLDNRYYNNIKNFDNGFIVSTLNAEIKPDSTISWLVGVGIKSNLVYVETIFVAGVKINLWRIKR